MHWDVTHSCGHIERHLIVVQFAYLGETRARQLKRRKCTSCYSAGKQARAADEATADDAVLAGIELPALVGSERQVDWAGKIRRERLAATIRQDPEAARSLAGQTEAKWWIDHRSQKLGQS
jgi:hypothetical protein